MSFLRKMLPIKKPSDVEGFFYHKQKFMISVLKHLPHQYPFQNERIAL